MSVHESVANSSAASSPLESAPPERPRIDSEPGVWSLVAVPVLVCLALLVFMTFLA